MESLCAELFADVANERSAETVEQLRVLFIPTESGGAI
jgi:hypothetical protein